MDRQHSGPGTAVKTNLQTAPGTSDERRRARRRRVLYRARIAFDNSALNCTVKDMTQFGCKLKFAVPPVLPETFDLIISKAGERRRCQLIWLAEREVGVRFIDTDA